MPKHDEWDGVSIAVEVSSDAYQGPAQLKRCWLNEKGEARAYQIQLPRGGLLTVPVAAVRARPRPPAAKPQLRVVK